MRTPLKPLPDAIARWTRWARLLRWLDAVVAWLALWLAAALLFDDLGGVPGATVTAVIVGAAALLPPIRVRWRPITAWVALAKSRSLRPGDRAWFVRPGAADLVLVTARRPFRVVIAGRAEADREVVSVRRTRVLLIAADEA